MAIKQEKVYTIEDYENLPENIRAEIIDGQIFYHAAPSRVHQEILGRLYQKITNYIDSKCGSCKVYPAPFAVKLSENDKTVVDPDISVICDTNKLTDKGCSGAPDWIIEIVSPGNSSHDYVKKLNKYLDAGVREYWIVNPKTETIFVYFPESDMVKSYIFQDKIKVNIYDDFEIDFSKIEI